MKMTTSNGIVEPLESRIAPATIFVGNPDASGIKYSDAPFKNTLTGVGQGDQISKVIGDDADVFYLLLNTGDSVLRFDAGYSNYITGAGGAPLKGSLVAVFVDKNQNNIVDGDELTGISLGKGSVVQISGSVYGDVVSNFNDVTKTIGNTSEASGATGTGLLLNQITSFAASSVTGSIVSGGDISGIKLTNEVDRILAGRAADGFTYDFNGAKADGGDTISVPNTPGVKGIKISNIAVGSVTRIEAGAGGAGAIGGDIANVTLVSDADGFTIKAGNGGDAASGKPNGGNGGKVSNIIINGVPDSSPNSLITIAGGVGGLGSGSGKGGTGGDVSAVSIGFEVKNGKLEPSVNVLADQVLVQAGNGSEGKTGGNGGKLSSIQVTAGPTVAGDGISIFSGAGGSSTLAGGKAGSGGTITSVDVKNPEGTAHSAFIKVHAGDGGMVTAGGKGGNGGAINGVSTIGFAVEISSGNGSDGSTGGGLGGDIKTVLIDDGFIGVRPEQVIINAGAGGAATAGKGSKAGSITGALIQNADFTVFDINQGANAANGGNGLKGGGAGGSVGDLTVNDVSGLNEATIRIRTGNGGSGGNAGSAGIFTGSNLVTAVNASLVLGGGNGGTSGTNGKGGNGGGIGQFAFVTEGSVGGFDATAAVSAGIGGSGNGKGTGGSGGIVKSLNLFAPGSLDVFAGQGGAGGATGAGGRGGDVLTFLGVAENGSINLIAGNAGAGTSKAALGGAVNLANLQAAGDISVQAGAGTAGGAGGSIIDPTFSDASGVAGATGFLTLKAGAGSDAAKKAGNGGSITGATGYISEGMNLISAGMSGGNSSTAANGGSITGVVIKGGGGFGSELRIEAGDSAGAAAKKGGLGGSVKDVSIDTLAAGTIFRRVAAGSGGDSTAPGGTGGLGGSIDGLNVEATIGVRSGEAFGYDTMGGIFAGQGGAGAVAGLSGNVTNVTADAIASIVAGRPNINSVITERNLVEKVDGIYLNGNVVTTVDANGTYTNFGVANLIGGVVDPLAVGAPYQPGNVGHPHANTFDLANGEFLDTNPSGLVGEFGLGDTTTNKTDGFIAAYVFNQATTNVSPEALLTRDAADGVIKFFDLNNLNGQKTVA